MLPNSRYDSGCAGPGTVAPSSSFAPAAIEGTPTAVSGVGRKAVASSGARPTAAISKAAKADSIIATANDSTGSDRPY
jgi:hypothetical protein